MPKAAGQELGSVLAPLRLLALLAGTVAGAVIGAVLAAVSAGQVAVDPEGFAGWGFGGLGLIPLLVGVPSGAVVAVAPAVGSAVVYSSRRGAGRFLPSVPSAGPPPGVRGRRRPFWQA